MVGSKSKLLCAGDDGQTIFTWAGASFHRFRHFVKHYPGCETHSLATNRRSTEHIVALSNDLMTQSVFATNKYSQCEANGPKVRIRNYPDQRERNKYIITQIERLVKEEIPYDQLAIIYRFYQDLLDLKEFLTKAGIPFKVLGDKSKRDRPIILVIFALINIIEAPTIDDNEWRTMLTFLEGVGKKRVEQIIEWLKAKKPEETVYPKPYRFTESLQELLQFINKLKKNSSPNPNRLLETIEYARTLPKVNSSIKEHIRPTLLQLAHECDSLSEIINKYFDRSYPLCYPVKDEPPYPDSYITLSTVHRVKGGGYDTVFYLGTQDHLYEKYGLFKGKRKKEGELQLMNVAVTRARRELHLLFPIDMETWENDEDASNPWSFVRDAYYSL
jgi:DNA helicase-2/ATP-dependent DNA helicase PcrA